LIYEVGKQIGPDLKSAGFIIIWLLWQTSTTAISNPVIGYRSFPGKQRKKWLFGTAYLRGLNAV
jgi:hypothetical protein